MERYEVLGSSLLKIIFVIETEEPTALNLLTGHFGDSWFSVTYPIIKREIVEALEEDLGSGYRINIRCIAATGVRSKE